MVQVVGQADVHHVHLLGGQQFVDVGVDRGDAMRLGKGLGVRLVPAVDGHHLRVGNEAGVTLGVDVGDEAGAQQGDFCLAHGKDPPFLFRVGRQIATIIVPYIAKMSNNKLIRTKLCILTAGTGKKRPP